jgi:hypothetical protein
MAALDLGEAMEKPTLQRYLHFAHTFVVRMAYTALANGRGKMEERLARGQMMPPRRSCFLAAGLFLAQAVQCTFGEGNDERRP